MIISYNLGNIFVFLTYPLFLVAYKGLRIWITSRQSRPSIYKKRIYAKKLSKISTIQFFPLRLSLQKATLEATNKEIE